MLVSVYILGRRDGKRVEETKQQEKLLEKSVWPNVLMICLILILTGCHQSMTNDFCLVYHPVSGTSSIKPDAQRIAVKRNNLKYEELCQ